MDKKLFKPVEEAHDGKGRIVFICEDPQGFYVYKPATGLKTRHWPSVDDEALQAAYTRQIGCTQNVGFLEEGEAPAADENYSLKKPKPDAAAADATQDPAANAATGAPAGATGAKATKTAPAKTAPRKTAPRKTAPRKTAPPKKATPTQDV